MGAESGSDQGETPDAASAKPARDRPGPIRRALRKAIKEARDAEPSRMTAEHEVRALLAERYAKLVDDATKSGNDAAMIRASDKLLEIMDTLPIRTTTRGKDGNGSGNDDRARVLELVDSPPKVGHTPHP